MKGTYWESRQKQGRFDFSQDVEFDEHYQITWLIGDYFEYAGSRIVGDKTELYDKMRAHERGSKVPDLVNWRLNKAYEVKGSSWGRSFKISVDQLKNYEKMEDEVFPLESPEINYIFFGYHVFGKWKDYKTEMNLIKTLCKSIRFAIIMPIEFVKVYSYTHPRVIWKRTNHYRGLKELQLINVKMIDMWDIQIRPNHFLEWVMREAAFWEVDTGECVIENRWSAPFKVCGNVVSKFPITEIKRKE